MKANCEGIEGARVRLSFIQLGAEAAPYVIIEGTAKEASKETQVVELTESSDDLQIVSCDASSKIHFAPWPEEGQATVLVDGVAIHPEHEPGRLPVCRVGESGLTISPHGSELRVDAGAHSYAVMLQNPVAARGSATIHGALFQALKSGSRAQLSRVQEVFRGMRSSGDLLGGPDSAGHGWLMSMGALFEPEGAPDSCYPVVMSLNDTHPPIVGSKTHGSVRTVGAHGAPASALRLSDEAQLRGVDQARLAEYRLRREELLAAVRTSFPKSVVPGRALYAAAPICHWEHDKRLVVEEALYRYLLAYSSIAESLTTEADQRDYAAQFLLVHLDTLVHIDEPGRILLAGPWHPLVAATRYFLQLNMLVLASEAASDPDTRRLVEVFDQLAPFRWLPGLRDETRPTPFYSGPSGDAGWYVAVPADGPAIIATRDLLVRALEIPIGLVPQAQPSTINHYLERYLRAFPSRRSLVARLGGAYVEEEVMTALGEFLFEDEDSPTEAATLLPGGVHLYFKTLYASAALSPSWTQPPMCIYQDTGSVGRLQADLFIAGGDAVPAFEPRNSEGGAARGSREACILMMPPRHIVGGQSPVPRSRADETVGAVPIAGDSNLGGAYLAGLWAAQDVGPVPMMTVWELPLAGQQDERWVIVPGHHADPAVFLEWSRHTFDGDLDARLLWDYSIATSGGLESYFVVSKIPPGFLSLIQGSFLPTVEVAAAAVRGLSTVGVAVGNEAHRSRNNALGVVGIIGAVRVTQSLCEGGAPGRYCLILPVDSFTALLGRGGLSGEDQSNSVEGEIHPNGMYGDLLVIQLDEESSPGILTIRISGIESKYRSTPISTEQAQGFLRQATATVDKLERIAHRGRTGVAHRWVLAQLVQHGLRLKNAPMADQRRVLGQLLTGQYRVVRADLRALLVSVEEGRADCSPMAMGDSPANDSWWVRIGPSHFPHVDNEDSLAELLMGVPRFVPGVTSDAGTYGDATPPIPPDVDNGAGGVPEGTEGPAGPSDPGDASSQAAGNAAVPGVCEVGEGATVELAKAAPRVLLGLDDQGTPVYYDAGKVGSGVGNYNVMVSGSSGNGKTQLIKSMAVQLSEFDIPSMFVDFKNDFASDRDFLKRANLEAHYVAHDGLPYNPMIPGPTRHPVTGELSLDLPQHISGMLDVFKAAYSLGEQQALTSLRGAMRMAYQASGINPASRMAADAAADWPDFNELAMSLANSDEKAFTRLSPLFDLGIFRAEYQQVSFASLLSRRLVVDVSQIQSDLVKDTLAHILIHSAHRFLNAQEHVGRLRQVFVFDEAHRVLESQNLEAFARECRAYGVGLMLASQLPEDFPEQIRANLATKILFGNGQGAKFVTAIRQLAGLPTAASPRIQDLGLFQAVVILDSGAAEFVHVVGYAHLVVWGALRHSPDGLTRDSLTRLPGIMHERLNSVLAVLKKLGLVTEADSKYRAVHLGV